MTYVLVYLAHDLPPNFPDEFAIVHWEIIMK